MEQAGGKYCMDLWQEINFALSWMKICDIVALIG